MLCLVFYLVLVYVHDVITSRPQNHLGRSHHYPNLLLFPNNHKHGFIHIYSHTSVVHKILPFIKPLN